jgi:hypothetical protein
MEKFDQSKENLFSKRVRAGKRTYFFDIRATKSGEDLFVTIAESRRVGEDQYEKHRLFLYKEDFGKFVDALHETIDHVEARLGEGVGAAAEQ